MGAERNITQTGHIRFIVQVDRQTFDVADSIRSRVSASDCRRRAASRTRAPARSAISGACPTLLLRVTRTVWPCRGVHQLALKSSWCSSVDAFSDQ